MEVPSTAEIVTTEMHTGGEPLRVIESGFPPVKGETILEKRRYIKEHFDNYRKLLMFEPRGHYDMYGVLLVTPDVAQAVMGCIFMHNEGFSTMCGHAMIALGRYAVDKGLVKNPTVPETKVIIQCPCGPVQVFVKYDGRTTGGVRFQSVPGFLHSQDIRVNVPGYGDITVDISYGGAFYAFVPAQSLGLDTRTSKVGDLKTAAGAVTAALKKIVTLDHPDSPDLAFLFGTILTDGKDAYSQESSDNICVFADEQVDRSPCGSGVTARIALQYNKGLLQLGQSRALRGLTGSIFHAKPVKEVTTGKYKAVIVEVSGNGYYTGTSTFTIEQGDLIGRGFVLK